MAKKSMNYKTRTVLDFVRNNPECTNAQVREGTEFGWNSTQMHDQLFLLKKHYKLIDSRVGVPTVNTVWFEVYPPNNIILGEN